MVAPRKARRVVCTVICLPAHDADTMIDELQLTDRPSNRLPWSDPTIAQLVANLQDEVRTERRQAKRSWRNTDLLADLDPPTPSTDSEWEWQDQPRFMWPD